MKKIKYLLLGIVSLLGIGCSFAVDVNNVFGSITNSNGTKHFYSNIATSSDTIFFMGMYNNNIGNVLFPNTQSNISSYNNRMYWVIFNTMGNVVFSPGSDAKLIGSFTLNWSNPNIRYYINGSGNFGFNYLHLVYLGGSSSKYSNYYMATSTGIYSSGLTIYDIQPGYERKKIFPLVSSSFSSISSNGTDFEFSYLPFDGISSDGIYNITGIVLFHFDFYTGGYVSGNNTIILFKDNSNIYYNIFDSYSDSVLDFVSTTPISKGVLSNGYSSFFEMIQDNGYMVETYGNLSSLIFHSINSQTTASSFTNISTALNTHPYNEYTFNLTENSSVLHWYDYLNGGGGNNNGYTSTGSISVSGCVDTQVCTYVTGDNGHIIKTCHISCVSQEVINSGGYISSDGTYYFINTPLSLDDLKKSDLTFSTGYLDSGGILNPIYFEDLFDPSKKAVGVCPFPYYSGPLDFLSDIGTDGVYLFMPLICFYSAFQHGSHLSFFDNSEVITGGVLTSPLLNGTSENHRILFMFLDILFSIGLLGLFHHLSSLL